MRERDASAPCRETPPLPAARLVTRDALARLVTRDASRRPRDASGLPTVGVRVRPERLQRLKQRLQRL